jgi:thioredoxin 1
MLKEIIKFGAPWCQGCTSADMALEQYQAMHPEVVVSKVDIEEDEDLANTYKVRGLPTLIFLDLEGKEVTRYTGKITIQDLIKIINDNGLQ